VRQSEDLCTAGLHQLDETILDQRTSFMLPLDEHTQALVVQAHGDMAAAAVLHSVTESSQALSQTSTGGASALRTSAGNSIEHAHQRILLVAGIKENRRMAKSARVCASGQSSDNAALYTSAGWTSVARSRRSWLRR
jgi:hypothetical protein